MGVETELLRAGGQIALAFLLALPIGWEREHHSSSKSGLRAYPLLSVCVCSFLLVARLALRDPGEEADVLYGVLNGIGFVGSGALVTSSDRVRGMSTMVSLWVTGAIGAAVAFDSPLLAAALCLMSLVALRAPSLIRRKEATA